MKGKYRCGPPRADPGRRNKSLWRSVMNKGAAERSFWLSYSEVCWCKLCKLCAVCILLRARLQGRPFNSLHWNYYDTISTLQHFYVIRKCLEHSFITFCQNRYFLAPAATWRVRGPLKLPLLIDPTRCAPSIHCRRGPLFIFAQGPCRL